MGAAETLDKIEELPIILLGLVNREDFMKRVFIFSIVLAVLTLLPVSATIINVPDDYPTIQEGIDAAGPGDTVLVAPDTYYENIQMAEGVNLIGSGMDNTIIDGGGLNDVIKAIGVNNLLIQGFSIRNSQQGGNTPGNVGVFLNPSSSSGTKVVKYCSVHNNGKGIDLWNDFGGTIRVEYNIIRDNIYDGFDPYLGTAHLTNNTIVRNGRDGYHDWAGGGTVHIKNNIIALNGRYGIFKHRDTPVLISYNDVWSNAAGEYYEGYSGEPTPFDPSPGTGEISADPLFVDPENDDFHLTMGSPCIDAGDPESPYDPDGTIADMGCFYFDQQTSVDDGQPLPSVFMLNQNHPNPFNASTTIRYVLPQEAEVTIEICDILGRRVERMARGEQHAGYHRVVWDASGMSSGLYFYRIQAGDYVESRKMVLLK